jgi:tetratricopeptide (TPR) repeat protein
MFEKVRERAPDNVRGMFNLGAAYVGMGRYEEAITLLEQSLAIRPEALAYTNLGNANFYLRRYERAAAAYEQATRLEPENMLLWWNLGDGYFWMGRRAQAAPAYERAIRLAQAKLKINPKDSSLLGILAICHAMRDERREAVAALEHGLRLSPSDPDLLFKAALIYNHFGQTKTSLTWLKKALAAGLSPSTVRDTPDFDRLAGDPRLQELLRGS